MGGDALRVMAGARIAVTGMIRRPPGQLETGIEVSIGYRSSGGMDGRSGQESRRWGGSSTVEHRFRNSKRRARPYGNGAAAPLSIKGYIVRQLILILGTPGDVLRKN